MFTPLRSSAQGETGEREEGGRERAENGRGDDRGIESTKERRAGRVW